MHRTLAKANADERHELAWSVILVVVLGAVLCLTSLASLVAVTFGEACGGLLLLSGFSGLLLGIFELCLLVTFGALKGTSLEFVETHKADFGLDEGGIETFKNMYTVLLLLLGGLVLAEVVRFRLSGSFYGCLEDRLSPSLLIVSVDRPRSTRPSTTRIPQRTGHLRRELALDWREARDYRERLLQVEVSEAGRRR